MGALLPPFLKRGIDMFCTKCGNQLKEGASFCNACGARVKEQTADRSQPIDPNNVTPVIPALVQSQLNDYNSPPVIPASAQEKAVSGNKKLIIGIIFAFIVIAVAVVLIFVLGGKKSDSSDKDDIPAYEKPLQLYCESIMEQDAEKLHRTGIPESYVTKLEKIGGRFEYPNLEELVKRLHKKFEKEIGKDFKLSYKVIEKTSIDKDELEGEVYREWARQYLLDSSEDESKYVPKEGYTLKIKLIIESEDKKDTVETTIIVLNSNGDWILSGYPDECFYTD